jgi:hypothetical protein
MVKAVNVNSSLCKASHRVIQPRVTILNTINVAADKFHNYLLKTLVNFASLTYVDEAVKPVQK